MAKGTIASRRTKGKNGRRRERKLAHFDVHHFAHYRRSIHITRICRHISSIRIWNVKVVNGFDT